MPDVFLRSVPSDSSSADVRLYDPTTADASGVIGSAAQTLGAVTQSAPGLLLIKGTASATLGSVTQVAASQLLIKGTTSQPLGAFTQSTTSKLLIKGVLANTLGAFTQSSVGTLTIKGTTSQPLGAVAQVAVGTVSQPSASTGSSAQTLDAFTQSAPATMSQPVVVTTPTQSTGGGPFGGMAWYDRKYRKQIRATIEGVLHDLNSTDDRRKKKRILRKAKAQVVEAVNFEALQVPLVLLPLEEVRLQLLQATLELVPIEEQLVKLMNDYKTNLRSIERNEEEAILAILLLAA